ncbi:MAG TPA: lysophospholipid acyltransferase family protein [Usitatibacter sp.]|nr:lysophospholipid acyltransferase family protein [Usitatibacter sp.]
MSALVPELGSEIPRRGSAVMRAFGRALLRLMRFRVEGAMPNLPKFVVAVAPHTSNWDFVIGAAAMFALDLRIAFLGKHTLFVGPFGPVMRWMGGIPVDRSSPHGVVGDAVAAFACVDRRILAIAPQGTRSPVPHFRTGFLQIARGAGVPVMLAAFDWEARIIRFGPTFEIGEDIEAERARTEAWFAPIRGRHPR